MIAVDPLLYAVAIPAVLLAGISKSGFGGAFGALGVPLLAVVMSPAEGAALMLPLLIAFDLLGLYTYRGKGDLHHLRVMLPPAIFGIVVGALTFRWMNDAALRVLIGLTALMYLAQQLRPLNTGAHTRRHQLVSGGLWGSICGFASFIANAGGPPFALYLRPQNLDKTVYVATSVTFFAAVNLIKLVPFVWLGLFDAHNLLVTLTLLPAVPLGYWLGLKILSRLDTRWFYRAINIAMALTGGRLLWDGVTGLLRASA